MEQVALVADGIGPAISQDIEVLTQLAHAQGLKVHAYTFRRDDLPKWAMSQDEVLDLLIHRAKVDGLFTDFPDMVVKWLRERQP